LRSLFQWIYFKQITVKVAVRPSFNLTEREGSDMFKKVLVPLDGSELAAKILPEVADLAKCMQADVTIMTIGSALTAGLASEFVTGAYEQISSQMKAQAEKNLADTVASMKAKGVKVNWIYKEGAAAAQEIIGYAADNSFDLIAMATHGKGEVAWIIGSVAEKVVTHATIPVLLLRVMTAKAPVSKEEYAVGPD
jgi:nucleotide-binding universal stress UspA family protein